MELLVLVHRRGLLLEELLHPVEVGLVGDRDVEHRAGPVLALVADAEDLAVADVPDRAVDVPESGDAQADRLDGAGGLAEVDRVADAVLVLEDHEDAADRKSLTRFWAPKPNAMPRMPALAMIGAMSGRAGRAP